VGRSTVKNLIYKASICLSKGRAIIRERAPYVATTLYGFVPYFLEGLTELAGGPIGVTEGMVLYSDPVWVIEQTPDIMAGCLMHEISHVVRDLKRLKDLPDYNLAGLAGDLAINPDLRKAKWELPEWVYYPEYYDFPEGLALEEYFALLYKKQKEQGLGQGQMPKGKGKTKPGNFGSGKCGGCAGNSGNRELEEKLDKEMGRGKADVKRIKTQTVREIQQAAKNRVGRGSMPGFFSELVVFKPKPSIIPWRQKLNRVVRKVTGRVICGKSDYSFKRLSKRSNIVDMIRPGMIDRQPNLVLIEDVSGSMGAPQIVAARNEEIAILKALGIDSCWLLQADAAVALKPTLIRLKTIPALKLYGRGGTSFVPALLEVQKIRPKPDLVFYLTDGDGDAPRNKPKGMEVVWVIVPTPYGRRPARWGHLVVCSDDQKLREPYEFWRREGDAA
jgi:predicted metal-dependent peptidase